jgi:hypothetical protein
MEGEMTWIFRAVWLLLGIAAAQAQSQTAASQPCWQDKISNTNGIQIKLQSGLSYQAYPGSQSKLSSWLPLDKVQVCRLGGSAVQVTDLSKGGQSVKALRLYQ